MTAPTRAAPANVVGDFDGYLHWLDPPDGRFLARERAAGDRIGSAPLARDGHLKVSPKGPIGSLRLLDEHTVA